MKKRNLLVDGINVLYGRGEFPLSDNKSVGRGTPTRKQYSKGIIVLLNVKVLAQLNAAENTDILTCLESLRIS